MPEIRLPTDRDHRREALVELFLLCIHEAGITTDYRSDVEYMEHAIEKFADAIEVSTDAQEKLVMLAEEVLRLDARDPVDEGPDGYQEADNVDAWPDSPVVEIATQVIAQRRHDV